ncbi:MAG: CoA ester lyase [Nisaea sp.]|uniref:HpcH/HpaI aldolase/citrate lyase family protein n=1 Tax=Nisaea sp. TaxID=2024842 RepID=UPI001B04D69E|nr:CoA ester lyase [Nisaea sp.]MBO6561958.1 CoA ester lyase [Nisaea sp.]
MTIHTDIVWRSLLYVPANNEKFISRAHTRGADALILDLEDSVPEDQRQTARDMLADAVTSVTQSGADATVRINRPLRHMVKDVEAAVRAGAKALFVTKVDSPQHLKLVDELVGEVEREAGRPEGSVRLIPMIESAAAYFLAQDIARASRRNVGVNLGGEDFALDVGMVPDTETLALPKQTLVFAAKAAGIMAMGFMGTVADYSDTRAFRATVRRSRKFGFEAASVIHPSGVPILNEEFTPTEVDVEKARAIVAAYDEATKSAVGAIKVDGMMIDVPVALRAQKLIRRYEAIRAKTA